MISLFALKFSPPSGGIPEDKKKKAFFRGISFKCQLL